MKLSRLLLLLIALQNRVEKLQDKLLLYYAQQFTYTAAGAVSSMQLGNGAWESTTFNSRLQPTQIALGSLQNGIDKLKLNYTYITTGQNNNNGNVLSQTITVPTVGTNTGFTATQNYTYDSINRLKSATETIGSQTWKQTFIYDRYGNRTFDVANTTTLGSCPAAQCNPTVSTTNNRFNPGQGYTFDNAGNTKTDAVSRQFTYDGENKQTEVKDQYGNSIGKYFYDGDGKRVKKIVGVETTIFVYDASGKLVAEYATTVEPAASAKVSYLTSDHLGSPRITTDKDGAVISRRDFMPFGEEISTSQRAARTDYTGDNIRKRFTGYERDGESELDFAQARYYNSSHGRFTSVDPLKASANVRNPQTLNRYSYVMNSPYKFIDPTGLMGEYYDRNGSYIGTDGIDDGKTYIADETGRDEKHIYVNIVAETTNVDILRLQREIRQNDRRGISYFFNPTTKPFQELEDATDTDILPDALSGEANFLGFGIELKFTRDGDVIFGVAGNAGAAASGYRGFFRELADVGFTADKPAPDLRKAFKSLFSISGSSEFIMSSARNPFSSSPPLTRNQRLEILSGQSYGLGGGKGITFGGDVSPTGKGNYYTLKVGVGGGFSAGTTVNKPLPINIPIFRW